MILFDEPVIEGRFLKRYKRFFIDALLPDDQQVVTHVPNTGSMLGLMAPNNRLLLTKSNDPKRKTLYTTQAIEVDGSMVGINTHLPNKLIKNSLDHPLLIDLKSYGRMQAEVPYGQGLHSRIDFYFSEHETKPPLYVEVKNTTMKKDHMAQFPDAVSERGQKHLVDLMKVKAQGFDAMLIFIVQRQDCLSFKASDIDLKYKELLGKAKDNGVLIRAICAQINERGLNLTHEIPCLF